jgi:hypothetical protein
LRLWSDAAERHKAFEDILRAWETDAPELAAAVARVDIAVEAGLAALGLPRGPVRDVRVEPSVGLSAGRKQPDCSLVFAAQVMREIVRVQRQPDDFFRTWVHESLHARQPYSSHAAIEYRQHRGYEEGMVEGLARLATRDKAGMRPLELSYAFYVGAYRTLAVVVGTDVERLWRGLWAYRTGEVRVAFGRVVDAAVQAATGRPMTPPQYARLQTAADRLFGTPRSGDRPNESALVALWRAALG